jgi:hypothetical protein
VKFTGTEKVITRYDFHFEAPEARAPRARMKGKA